MRSATIANGRSFHQEEERKKCNLTAVAYRYKVVTLMSLRVIIEGNLLLLGRWFIPLNIAFYIRVFVRTDGVSLLGLMVKAIESIVRFNVYLLVW